MLFIRATARAKEMAIRQSMGASPRRLIRQILLETVLLTLVGGVFGLIAGAWGIEWLRLLGAQHLPLGTRISFDAHLGAWSLLASAILGALIALPVAWFSLQSPLAHALQTESRVSTSGPGARRLRHAFIIAQIALAFVLLSGAAFLGLSLKRAMAVSPGFNPDHLLTGEMLLSWKNYDTPAARLAFADRLLGALARQPGSSLPARSQIFPSAETTRKPQSP
ncbi:MAG: FtsX-like permease family protein [Chthoniobacterales bacterium]